jgi:hypothetical protein
MSELKPLGDNEIIKALESFIQDWIIGYYDDEEIIVADVLSIINRQKAEIERLQGEVDKVNHDYILLCSDVAENRAEAIKEFAERLKSVVAIHNGDMWSKYEYIDNLVKEMVGDDK